MSVNHSQLVVVVWDDAQSSSTKQIAEGDIPHMPSVMTTLGWCLRDDEKGISVANERFLEDGMNYYRGHTFVPRGMIKSVTPFVLSTPRSKRKKKEVTP